MLDPILTAVIGGAAAAMQGVASDAVTAAYSKLKAYLGQKFDQIDVSKVEQNPDSEGPRTAVAEELRQSGADKDEQLTVLARDLLTALRKIDADAAPASSRRSPDVSSDALPIFLDIATKKELVVKFPIGPAVDIGIVPVDDLATDLSQNQSAAQALAIVNNANRIRRMADPKWPANAICIGGLPNPAVTGHYTYWFEAVDQARIRGPRMLAALLLSLPLNTWLYLGESVYAELEAQDV